MINLLLFSALSTLFCPLSSHWLLLYLSNTFFLPFHTILLFPCHVFYCPCPISSSSPFFRLLLCMISSGLTFIPLTARFHFPSFIFSSPPVPYPLSLSLSPLFLSCPPITSFSPSSLSGSCHLHQKEEMKGWWGGDVREKRHQWMRVNSPKSQHANNSYSTRADL